MRLFNALFLFAISAFPTIAAPAKTIPAKASPERSVVQITTFIQQPAWDAPWRLLSVQKATGTGFVIEGNRIMTNAHVVSWARQILVQRYQDPRPVAARVKFIGHDCDLAILEVANPAFFTGMQPLQFGGLPEVRSTVLTYGYPAGGDQISYTRGVVSRIEMQGYSHSGNRMFLSVQTDAAINPGNSGGPVLQEDKVVGVAFQGSRALENTGFFIPTNIVAHFLKDIEDGEYDGFPDIGLQLAPLINAAYRAALGLPDDGRGARVDSILHPFPETEKLMREDDVVLKVGEYEVGADCLIQYEGNRVHMGVAFDNVQHGESVPMVVWRDKKELTVSVPVYVCTSDRAEGNQYDKLPRYYLYGGLLFTPLSADYLKTLGRGGVRDASAQDFLYELSFQRLADPKNWRAEPVVFVGTLAHEVNANLSVRGRAIVDKINGVRIESLAEAVKALDSGTNTHHIIEFLPGNRFECIDRVAAEKATPQILKTYRVPIDRRL